MEHAFGPHASNVAFVEARTLLISQGKRRERRTRSYGTSTHTLGRSRVDLALTCNNNEPIFKVVRRERGQGLYAHTKQLTSTSAEREAS